MSAVSRQHTCAACGGPLTDDAEVEVLIDDTVRHVVVHPGHSITPVAPRRETSLEPARDDGDLAA